MAASADDQFIGRRDALRTLSERLTAGTSVALVGAPGVGKTRLAAECARGLADEVVVHVKLAEVRSAEALVAAVGDAFGVFRSPSTDAPAAPARVLRAMASHGPGVVVLDGLEELQPDAEAQLRAWIDASPLCFLLVSRRRLGWEGPQIELGPLEVNSRQGWSEAATLLRVRAKELAKVVIDELDREVMHELGRRLDGLPLAIELAAARLGVLTPAQLLARLDRRFETLDGDARGLAAALETSYALLDEPARAVLRACSVFRGPTSLDALEAVAEAGQDVLGPLSSLRAHSLLEIERVGDENRYALSQSVRDFVERREREHPGRRAARSRHARWFARAGTRLAEVPAVHAREIDDVCAALAAAYDATYEAEPSLIAELTLALAAPAVGLAYAEVHALVTRALEHVEAPPRAVAELLFRRGTVRRFLSDFSGATADLDRALVSAEALGDRALVGDVLAALGNTRSGQADWPGSRRYLERALLANDAGAFQSSVLAMIANTFSNEDAFDRAEPLLRQAIALAEEHHDAYGDAFARLSLGILLVERGAFDEAFGALIDAVSILETSRSARVMQAKHLRSVALTHLARVKQETGDTGGALTDYHEAVAIAEDTGARRAEAFAHYGLASLLLELRELRAADDRIRAAFPLVRENCKDVEGALVALHGVLFALRGARADAERFFRRAEVLLVAHQRPVFESALRVLRGADPADTPYAGFADVRLAQRLRGLFAETTAEEPLFVAQDGSFFRPPGAAEQVSLARRKALRAIFAALVEARVARPGVPLSVDALVGAGWPGERILSAAGAERVYAAIATLRRLGLRGLLVQHGEGYLIRADCPIATHDRAANPVG